MAPTFRSSRSGRQFIDNSANRNRSGQIDHDIFEGLPVRRWSRQPYTFSQTPKHESSSHTSAADGSQRFPELPMPKDSHLLSPMSRALLRAARAGYIYLRRVSKSAEEEEKEIGEAEESAPISRIERSFTARKWSALPRHLEPPEVEFLAERKPGLPSLYGASATSNLAANGPNIRNQQMRKTKFRKVDPLTGKLTIYDAWIPEGHTLEGEIIEGVGTSEQRHTVASSKGLALTSGESVSMASVQAVIVTSADPGTVITLPKKRPPPPKRKAKGIGKGRRKRVMFAPGEGADATTVHARIADAPANTDWTADVHAPLDDSTGENIEGEEDEEYEEEEDDEAEREAREADEVQNGEDAQEGELARPPDNSVKGFGDIPALDAPFITEPGLKGDFAEPTSQPTTVSGETQRKRKPEILLQTSEEQPDLSHSVLTVPEAKDNINTGLPAKISLMQEQPAGVTSVSAPAPTLKLWHPPAPNTTDVPTLQVKNTHSEVRKPETPEDVEVTPIFGAVEQPHSAESSQASTELLLVFNSEEVKKDATASTSLVPDLPASIEAGSPIRGDFISEGQQPSEIPWENGEVDRLSDLEVDLEDEIAKLDTQENGRVSPTALQPNVVEEVNSEASASDIFGER